MMLRKESLVCAMVLVALPLLAATTPGSLTFSNTFLLKSYGTSEPGISIGSTGLMAIDSLGWNASGTVVWMGQFGSTPSSRGGIDINLSKPGAITFGGGDAELDLGSTGTLHGTTIVFPVNPTIVNPVSPKFTHFQVSISAIACPNASPTLDLSTCTKQIIDLAGNDRPWITSDGSHVYISYHDAANSATIRVQRSDDDGFTWKRVGDAISGQGFITASSTFNNGLGPIVADPTTHNVYQIYSAGQPGILKAKTADFRNVFVARSTDLGKSWTSFPVFQGPPLSTTANLFPSLAVDPTNGNLYATWSDGATAYFSASTNQGVTWSSAVAVNIAPADTAVFAWVAAYNGTVDVVYYGTTGTNTAGAVWNAYLAQTTNGGSSFTQSLVSNSSNHTGVICLQGSACDPATRTMLDLFQVAIDPLNGLAAVVYADDAHTTDSAGNPLPQTVLAQQQ
jgi:hypothetical protein